MLTYQDVWFGGYFANQIAKSCSSFESDTIKKILDYVCAEGHNKLMFVEDNDGDIPLHSAVQCKADQSTVFFFATACGQIHSILLAQNSKKQTPLEVAFELCHWPGVEVLLRLSIEKNVLTYLTGIKIGVPQSETLLHEAFDSGYIRYFQILLNVCKNLEVPKQEVMKALLLGDARGKTAWYYLMSRNKYSEIELALSLLSHEPYEADVNSLYTDTLTKSSLLHEASWINDKECIALLKKYTTESIDSRGVKPYQRIHQLVLQSSEPSKEIQTEHDFVKDTVNPYISEHEVKSVKDLVRHLEEIGKLEMLCLNLNLETAIINEIINSREHQDTKRLRCFQAYFDSGHATWEEVIAAVLGPHIHNMRVAKSIAKEYNISMSQNRETHKP